MNVSQAQPLVTDEMAAAAERALREEYFLRGESVSAFEESFADYVGTEHALAVDSGTQALHLSLRALGVSEGDAVITTPATFLATANAIIRAGATPVFVDVSLETYTIDVSEVETVLDERDDVAAILPVHLYGYPAPIERLRAVAEDIPILADSCQAHGAAVGDDAVGSMTDVAGFSFYPSKNMTVAGDGGMITTDDDDVARAVREFRDVGRDVETGEHVRLGYTARMNTIQAAIGLEQLDRLEEWNQRRREVAAVYTDRLADVDGIELPPMGDDSVTPAWYVYAIRTDRRDELRSFLEERGVETGIHYETPIHLQPSYRERGYADESYPRAERWADSTLSLPMHATLSDAAVDHVIESVRAFFEV